MIKSIIIAALAALSFSATAQTSVTVERHEHRHVERHWDHDRDHRGDRHHDRHDDRHHRGDRHWDRDDHRDRHARKNCYMKKRVFWRDGERVVVKRWHCDRGHHRGHNR